MDNNTFAICVVKLRPEISKRNPSVASILEKFSLNLLEQDRIVSELSDEQILKFKGVGPAALKAIRSIERGEGLQGMPLHTSSRLAELSGVAGALDKDGYLLQAQP